MKKIDKRDIWLLLAQVAMWIIILMALPLATLLSTHDFSSARTSFFVAWGLFHAPMVIYFVNFYILGPYLFFKRRFFFFFLGAQLCHCCHCHWHQTLYANQENQEAIG